MSLRSSHTLTLFFITLPHGSESSIEPPLPSLLGFSPSCRAGSVSPSSLNFVSMHNTYLFSSFLCFIFLEDSFS